MIDRSMLKHHIVGINNPLRFAAWTWMLSSARYKDGIYYDAGHEINLKRGQFVCGRKFMAGETGMTEKQVRVFLAALERSGMCLKTVHPKGQGITIITICNYDAYQDYTAYKESKGPRLGPSKGQGRAKVGPHSVTPDETPDEIKVLKKDTKVSTKQKPKTHSIPNNWHPGSDGITYAIKQGIPERMVEDEIIGFISYWSDQGNRRSEKGWYTCWQGRCRQIGPQAKRNSQMVNGSQAFRNGQNPSLAAIVAGRRGSNLGGDTDRGEGVGTGQGDFIDGEFHAASD